MGVPADNQDSADKRDFVDRLVLNYCETEYRELSDTWRGLEQKAQGATAIVGIFLASAGILANHAGILSTESKMILLLAVVVILAAALFAVLSLRVRHFETLDAAETVRDEANKVFQSGREDGHAGAIREFLDSRVKNWVSANTALHEQNNEKAGYLSVAHVLIMIGSSLLLYVFGVMLFVR
jgi:hypothetical protein